MNNEKQSQPIDRVKLFTEEDMKLAYEEGKNAQYWLEDYTEKDEVFKVNCKTLNQVVESCQSIASAYSVNDEQNAREQNERMREWFEGITGISDGLLSEHIKAVEGMLKAVPASAYKDVNELAFNYVMEKHNKQSGDNWYDEDEAEEQAFKAGYAAALPIDKGSEQLE